MLAQSEDGGVRQNGGHGGLDAYPHQIPSEVWRNALDARGYGRIRIIELPPAQLPAGDWAKVSQSLVVASVPGVIRLLE